MFYFVSLVSHFDWNKKKGSTLKKTLPTAGLLCFGRVLERVAIYKERENNVPSNQYARNGEIHVFWKCLPTVIDFLLGIKITNNRFRSGQLTLP